MKHLKIFSKAVGCSDKSTNATTDGSLHGSNPWWCFEYYERTVLDMARYYDPEYDRFVDEDVIKKQYEWFAQFKSFHKTYEEFRDENFRSEEVGRHLIGWQQEYPHE